ncbi:M48 family metalloprotease [bacterium]|nr:MAG: M48 family metalloprotease [bacterium]
MKKQIKKYFAALTLLLIFTVQTTQAHSEETNTNAESDSTATKKIFNNESKKIINSFKDKSCGKDYANVWQETQALIESPETSWFQNFRSSKGLMVANEHNAPYIYGMIEKYATKLGIAVPTIFLTTFELNNACASSLTPNYGFIMIGKTLLQYSTTEKIEAIIAHELAHIKHNHIPRSIALYCASNYVLGSVLAPLLLPENLITYCSDYLPICVHPIGPVIVAGSIIISRAHGRYCEREADLTAISILEQPAALGQFFETLPFSNEKPEYTTLWENMQYYLRTHPEIPDRIAYCNQAVQARENNNSSNEHLAAPAA